jgi:ribosomal protein L16 Arg81 hydroxylase
VYYKIAQQSLHYVHMQNKPNEDEFLQSIIDNLIQQFEYRYKTPEDIKNLHRKLLGTDFQLNNKDFFSEIASPALFKSRFNELGREKNILRDSKIVESIVEYWNKDYSVFVVYGSGHIIIQEQALEKFLD